MGRGPREDAHALRNIGAPALLLASVVLLVASPAAWGAGAQGSGSAAPGMTPVSDGSSPSTGSGLVMVPLDSGGTGRNLTLGATSYASMGSLAGGPEGTGISLSYDPVLGTFLAFGGASNASSKSPRYTNDTWMFDSGGWHPLCPEDSNQSPCGSLPEARAGATLLWDPADGVELLIGGWGPNSNGSGAHGLNDVWSYSADKWTNVSLGLPPGIWNGAVTYDSQAGYVLAVSDTGATFAFSGGLWSRVDSAKNSPPARTGAAIFDDAALGGVVLFGGVGAANQTLNDTWLFTDGRWAERDGSTAPSTAGMPAASVQPGPLPSAYDPNVKVGVVFDPSGTGTNETWTLGANGWTNRSANLTGPAAGRPGAALAWDPTDGYGLLYESNTSTPGEAWSLSDPLVVDSGAFRGVIDSGQSYLFTPTFSAGMPPYRSTLLGAPVGCSLGQNASAAPLLFCNEASSTELNLSLAVLDAIGRSGTIDYRLVVHADPVLRVSEVEPDPTSVGIPVHFAGYGMLGTPPYSSLTWSFDGSSGGSNATPSIAFDSAGNHSYTVRMVDAVGVAVTARGSLWVNPDPAALLVTNRSPTPEGATEVGVPLGFVAEISGGTGSVSCAWDFGGSATATGCDPSHAYQISGSHSVRFWANDSLGAVGTASLSVGVAPAVEAVLEQPSAGVLVGDYLGFQVSGQHGIGPYQVTWSFGDGGTATASNASHAYGIPGTYTATATVTDAVGGVSTANETVTVSPALGPPPGGDGTGPAGGGSGSMIVPGGVRPTSTPSTMPGLVLEISLAIAAAAGWMGWERWRRDRGGSSVGWVRRALFGAAGTGPTGGSRDARAPSARSTHE